MEDVSCLRLLIGTRLVTGTRLLSVGVALTPGLYPGPGDYAGPGFYIKFYGISVVYPSLLKPSFVSDNGQSKLS